MTDHVVIVQPASSGLTYIPAAIRRGLIPIVIIPCLNLPGFDDLVSETKKALPGVEIDVCKDSDEVLSVIDGRRVIAVFAGGDPAVALTDELNMRLGLRGNDPSTHDCARPSSGCRSRWRKQDCGICEQNS